MLRKIWNRRGLRQISLFLVVYLLYLAARWIFVGDYAAAEEHAKLIFGLEQSGGLAVEQGLQKAFSAGFWPDLFSSIYLAAQLFILPLSLIWLWFRKGKRRSYYWLRNTICATWMISIPIFALFPVAPPRLDAIGLADTVSDNAGSVLTGHSTIFYNPFAAMPSLHVGFAFAIGIAVASAIDNKILKGLALSWGPLVAIAVMVTGNHFLLDAIAGISVTIVGALVGYLVNRYGLRAFNSEQAGFGG